MLKIESNNFQLQAFWQCETMRSDSSHVLSENFDVLDDVPSHQVTPVVIADYVGPADIHASDHIKRAIRRFLRLWRHNRTEILHLAVVNVMTTLVMEACVRTLLSKVFHSSPAYDFFVHDHDGLHINSQSLTNMWITALTSLFGGPVLFISTRLKRYMFFVSFGLIVSVLGQVFAVLSLGAAAPIVWTAIWTRLAFDFCYTSSVKFFLFELARKPLLSAPPRISLRIGAIRLGQDFSTTFIRVSILNLLRLKG